MASATFTLRAVDATRAAFASVQNSLGRLEAQTKSIAKITKLAFGGEAVLGTLNMMRQRLDKVVESGADMGFSDEQIASAIRFEDLINGVLNTLTKIPLAMAQMGFAIGNAFAPLTEGEIEERIRRIKFDRAKKEIDGTVEATRKLQQEFDLLSVTQGQAADEARRLAIETFKQAVATMATDPAKGMKLQQDALAMLNRSKETGVTLDKEIVEAQRELNKTLPEAQRVGLSQAELIDGLRNRYSTLTYEVSQLNVALSAFKDVGGPVGATQEQIVAKLKEQAVVSAQLNKLLEDQGKVAREAGQITAGAFENAILSGEKLRDTIKALARDLLALLFRQQITEPLAKALGASSFFAGFFGGPRAGGGPVGAGTAYLVGEKGPELFVPNASGSIIPNQRISAGGGGGGPTVNVNYHIAAGVTRAELVPILETERKRLKAEIPDMVRRGGAYRAAFA
jgi:hypothetical protein